LILRCCHHLCLPLPCLLTGILQEHYPGSRVMSLIKWCSVPSSKCVPPLLTSNPYIHPHLCFIQMPSCHSDHIKEANTKTTSLNKARDVQMISYLNIDGSLMINCAWYVD
jgi:hypothetical protein